MRHASRQRAFTTLLTESRDDVLQTITRHSVLLTLLPAAVSNITQTRSQTQSRTTAVTCFNAKLTHVSGTRCAETAH